MESPLRKIFDELEHPSDKWDQYFEAYERHLDWVLFSSNVLTLVEVGIQNGGSLEMWSKFLGPNNQIIGIDNNPECAKLRYKQDNIKIVLGDQGNPDFWDHFLRDHPSIDIFIDDAGHFMGPQILTFEKVFPRLNIGGVYIVEDTHTSYMPSNRGGLNREGTFIEYSKMLMDRLHSDWNMLEPIKDLTSIHFYDSMVVFSKLGKEKMKRVHPKIG